MPLVGSFGVNIHFTVDGDGFPIILHTGAGGDATMWQQAGYVEGLRGLQCILIDHRGQGKSDRAAGLENHAIDCYVDDIIAVLDVLHIERAAFWGNSSGCAVGYALAATRPERVTALIASGAIGARDYSESEERARVQMRAVLVREQGLGELINGLEQTEGTTFPAWFWRQMLETDREMFVLELLGESMWRGPWSILHQIRCPVLMLAGETEDPEDINWRAASVLRDAHTVTFQGLGHVGAYLRRDLALAQAVPFVRPIWNAGAGDIKQLLAMPIIRWSYSRVAAESQGSLSEDGWHTFDSAKCLFERHVLPDDDKLALTPLSRTTPRALRRALK